MERSGPSPVVPFVMVVGLGLLIYWPALVNLSDSILPLFSYFVLVLLVLLLFLLVHWLSLFFSIGKSSSPFLNHQAMNDTEAYGLGLGSFLFFLLFLVLYNLL